MSNRLISPNEKLLYEKAERTARELQANSKSEAFKAVKIQPYEVYAGTMERLAPGGFYPSKGKEAYGANSMMKPDSGTEEGRKHWNKLAQVSGSAESSGDSYFYSRTPFNPSRPNPIGFLSRAEMEDQKLKNYTSDADILEFRSFEEGAAFFQEQIGDLYHGTGNPGGYIGDTPHFLGKVSTANQGALYVSPSSLFSELYTGAQQDWNLGQGGHLYKGKADFSRHNIFNPWNPDDVAALREHLLDKDYSEDELLAIQRAEEELDYRQGLESPDDLYSDLSKEELRPRIDRTLDDVMGNVSRGSWGTLQDQSGPKVPIPKGEVGAGELRGVYRINDSLREMGYTGWLEFENSSINMALFDTAKAGEKTNIPDFKFTEKRIITPRVSVDKGFAAATGEPNTVQGPTGNPSDQLPNPNHIRRTIAGEKNSDAPHRGMGGPTPIKALNVDEAAYDYSTGWHRAGSVSAYDAIAQELAFRKGEQFQWERGRLDYDSIHRMNSHDDAEFRRLVADPLIADMRSLSESPNVEQKLGASSTDPEIGSKAGSAIDPSSPGTPGGPQPPPAGSAIDSAIDSIDSGKLGQADSASTGSAINSNGKSAAGDLDPPPGIRSAADEIAQKSLPSSAEGGKGVDAPKASSSSDMAIARGGNTAEGKSADAGSKAQGESSSRAGAAAGEKEAKAASGGKSSAKADSAPGASKAEEVVEELTEKQKAKYKSQIAKAQAIIDDPGVPEGEKNAARNLINKLSNKLGMSPGDPAAASSGGGPSKPSSGAAAGSSGGGGQPPPPPPPRGGNASGNTGNTGNAGSRAAGAGGAGGGPPPPPPPRNPPGAGGGPNAPGGNGRPPGTPPGGPPGGGGSPGGGPAGGGGGPGGPHWNRAPGGTASGAHAAAGGAGGAKAAGANAARKPLNIKGGVANAYGNIRSAFSNFFKGGGGPRGPRGGFGTVAGAAAAAGRPGTRTSSIIKAWAFNSSLLEREMDLTTRGFVAGLGSIVNDLGLNRRESAYGTNGKASAYIDTFFGTTIRGGKGFAHPSMEVASSGTRTGRVVWSTKATAQEALEGWSTHIDDAVTHSSGVMRGMNRMRQFMFNLFGGKTSTVNRTIARLGGVGTLVAPGFMGFSAVSDFRDGYRHGGIAGGLVGAVKGVATGWIVNKMMATALLNPAAAIITAAALGATAYTAYKIFDVRNKGSEYLKMGRMQGMSWNKGPSMGMNSSMANTIKHRSIMGMENSRLNASRSMGNESYMQSAPKSRYANSTAIHSNSSLLSLANS